MQGYAYILTHPGTPAVFYDHIFSHYKQEISNLISLRHRKKIHCRSVVCSSNLLALVLHHLLCQISIFIIASQEPSHPANALVRLNVSCNFDPAETNVIEVIHFFCSVAFKIIMFIKFNWILVVSYLHQVKITNAERDVYAAEIDEKIAVKIGPGCYEPSGLKKWNLAAEDNEYRVWEAS